MLKTRDNGHGLTLAPGVQENTRYRILLEAYRPSKLDKYRDRVPGTGIYYTVRGSSTVFEATGLAQVQKILEGMRGVLKKEGVPFYDARRRAKAAQ